MRKFPSISSLLNVFIMKECWILPNTFSLSMEVLMCFFPLFINMEYYFDWFLEVKPTLHSWDKSLLVMVYNPCYMFLEWTSALLPATATSHRPFLFLKANLLWWCWITSLILNIGEWQMLTCMLNTIQLDSSGDPQSLMRSATKTAQGKPWNAAAIFLPVCGRVMLVNCLQV